MLAPIEKEAIYCHESFSPLDHGTRMTSDTASPRVLITGAGAGIGQATAVAFGEKGARLALADIAPMNATREMLDRQGVEFECFTTDVSSEESVSQFLEASLAFMNGIDAAVHCAGVLTHAPLLSTTADEFDAVINVNLRGTFFVGREVLRHMNSVGSGRLINIASDLSYVGREEFSAYCASKAAVLSLTRTWALEFAPRILVNAICPGPIDTAMLDEKNMSAEWRNKERDIPLARFGRPEEVAQTALFLAGEGAEFITGQGIGVNGGSVMP